MAGAAWPLWDAENDNNKQALDKWVDYSTAAAANLGDSVDYYEVYNEWRGKAKSQLSQGNTLDKSAAAYAELLKRTSTAIKTADPGAKIVAFCTFYFDDDAEWLNKVLTALGDNP